MRKLKLKLKQNFNSALPFAIVLGFIFSIIHAQYIPKIKNSFQIIHQQFLEDTGPFTQSFQDNVEVCFLEQIKLLTFIANFFSFSPNFSFHVYQNIFFFFESNLPPPSI